MTELLSPRTSTWVLGRTGAVLLLSIACWGCAEETHDPVPEAPGTFLLDHEWEYQDTGLVLGEAALPFPNDPEIVEQLGNAELEGDALHGARLRFGADRRVLIEPSGFEEFADFGARYSVVDARTLRLELGESQWFPYEYHFDAGARVLLLNPEPLAGAAVVKFLDDLLGRIVLSGPEDGNAAKLADALFEEPRVALAIAALLDQAVTGELVGTPAGDEVDPELVANWLYDVLGESGAFDPELGETTRVDRLVPVVEEITPLAASERAGRLVNAVLDADVLAPELASERSESALRFALYRRVLETPANLNAIERIEIELEEAN